MLLCLNYKIRLLGFKDGFNLLEYLTYVNYLINKECYNLGIGMGLSKELLREVIFWSVGTCWIADNYETYNPNKNILKKIKNINTKLQLRTTKRITWG